MAGKPATLPTGMSAYHRHDIDLVSFAAQISRLCSRCCTAFQLQLAPYCG